jgi:hypothetical protein
MRLNRRKGSELRGGLDPVRARYANENFVFMIGRDYSAAASVCSPISAASRHFVFRSGPWTIFKIEELDEVRHLPGA